MNYLAHLVLADDSAEGRLGSLLADFTNLPNDRLAAAYGPKIAEAVILHRELDLFTDTHPAVAEAVKMLFSRCRHASRVIVDIVFDHYLSRHWNTYCGLERREFIRRCYELLGAVSPHDPRFPERFRLFARRMPAANILDAYSTIEGVERVLELVAGRVSCGELVRSALPEVHRTYAALERCFLRFFPDACARVVQRGQTTLVAQGYVAGTENRQRREEIRA